MRITAPPSPHIQTTYLRKVYYLEEFEKTFREVDHKLAKIRAEHPFESIVFTGQSGSALAYPISLMRHIHITNVRKVCDDSHHKGISGRIIEGFVQQDMRYLILDDQIDSGASIDRMLACVKEIMPQASCVGILLYHQYQDRLDLYNSLPVWYSNADF